MILTTLRQIDAPDMEPNSETYGMKNEGESSYSTDADMHIKATRSDCGLGKQCAKGHNAGVRARYNNPNNGPTI